MWEEQHSWNDTSSGLDDWDAGLDENYNDDNNWEAEAGEPDWSLDGVDELDNCWECAGTEQVVCTQCDGNGEQMCEECAGSGYAADDSSCSGCEGYGFVDCHECEATGHTQCTDCA